MVEHAGRTSPQALGIVPALDLLTVGDLQRVVSATCEVEGIVAYKLGLQAVLHIGLFEAVATVRALTDLPIIYDHQKAGADMPDSAEGFVHICAQADIAGLILFPVAGPTAVREFVGHTLAAGLDAVVGGHIPVPDYTASGGGYFVDDVLDLIARDAVAVGAKQVVLPANDTAGIRRRSRWLCEHVADPVVYLTGIGPLGGTIAESFAAAEGVPVRRAVVGRRICSAVDPRQAAESVVAELEPFR